MKITGCQIYQYSLFLRRPLNLLGKMMEYRSGIMIQLSDDEGRTAYGEIAPLPGFSAEDFKKAHYQILSLKPRFATLPLPDEPRLIIDWLTKESRMHQLSPSVHFGVEMAILELIAKKQGKLLYQLLGYGVQKEVECAALLQGSIEDITQQAKRLRQDGYRVFKLKVGSKNIPLDVKKTDALRAAIGKEGVVRLDANRQWDLKQAVLFGQQAGFEQIQFIEEPVDAIQDMAAFFKKTKIPVALDESLASLNLSEIKAVEGIRALILKPTLLGGLLESWAWIKRAQRSHLSTVISSSFESSVGLKALAQLAMLTDQAAGLGTAEWFQDDLVRRPLLEKGPMIPVERMVLEVNDLRMTHLSKF